METSNELAKRFREVYINGQWIANTNYVEILSDILYEQANTKILGLNSIGLLTNHVNYYLEGVLEVFEGKPLSISDKNSFNFKDFSSEKAWADIKNRLKSNAELFANHIEKMSEADLNAVFIDEKYGSFRRNIEGLIEHSYYHLGQISLVKKLTKGSEG